MKRYKLKRDLPTFNAGDEFCLNNNNDLYLKDSNIMAYNHITLEKFPNILTDWFEEIPEKYERWRGGIGDVYYFLNVDVRHEIDTHDDIDDYRYISGNYFKTEEDAEAYKEYLIARQVLLDDAHGGRFSYGEDNWCPCYSETSHNWVSISGNTYYPGTIYFKTREALEESLKNHKDQWEIVRKYEMGEIE